MTTSAALELAISDAPPGEPLRRVLVEHFAGRVHQLPTAKSLAKQLQKFRRRVVAGRALDSRRDRATNASIRKPWRCATTWTLPTPTLSEPLSATFRRLKWSPKKRRSNRRKSSAARG